GQALLPEALARAPRRTAVAPPCEARFHGPGEPYRDLGPEAKGRPGTGFRPECPRRSVMTLPFDQRDGVIWYDGKLVPWKDAKLHVLSHGLHYASCVFEGERAYGGEIFKCTEHSERLRESARLLDFEIPYSVAEIDAAKRLVIERNGQVDAYVRPVAWRGSEMMAVSAQNTTIHVAIGTWEWPSYFD